MKRSEVALIIAFLIGLILITSGFISADDRSCDELPTDYAYAYHRSIVEGKPLLVVLSGIRCKACQELKSKVIDPMRRAGEFNRVSLAIVEQQDNPKLFNELKSTARADTVPAVALFVSGNSPKVHVDKSPKTRVSIQRLLDKLRD